MTILRVARQIAGLRVAGPTTVMLKDLGYFSSGVMDMLEKFEHEVVRAGGRDRAEEAAMMSEAKAGLVAAAEKEIPGFSANIKDGYQLGFIWHEVEHKLLDPDFDIGQEKSEVRHPVESAMEEAIAAAMEGYSDSIAEAAYHPSAEFVVGDASTVGEALDRIRSAPMSSDARKKLRDAALNDARRLLKGSEDMNFDDESGLDKPVSSMMDETAPLDMQVTAAFLDSVVRRYKDHSQNMPEESEAKMRRIALRVKLLLQRIQKKYE